MSFVALLFFTTLVCNEHEFVAGADGKYEMSDLLKAQLRFEINLILPNSQFVSSHSLPPALMQSMEYLAENQIPFRLLYNINDDIRQPSPTRTARNTENRIRNLVCLRSLRLGSWLRF